MELRTVAKKLQNRIDRAEKWAVQPEIYKCKRVPAGKTVPAE
jgi:hypothetical protein